MTNELSRGIVSTSLVKKLISYGGRDMSERLLVTQALDERDLLVKTIRLMPILRVLF